MYKSPYIPIAKARGFTATFGNLQFFLSEKQIKEWNIKTIEGNLLDDGLLLWNNTDAEWERLFKEKFSTVAKKEIYYKCRFRKFF